MQFSTISSYLELQVRYHRMRGCETVWVPGSDHAGIATQVFDLNILHCNCFSSLSSSPPVGGCGEEITGWKRCQQTSAWPAEVHRRGGWNISSNVNLKLLPKPAILGGELAKGEGRGDLGPIVPTGSLTGLEQKPVHPFQRVQTCCGCCIYSSV